MAGLSRAKANGTQLGRRRIEDADAGKVTAIVAARAKGTGIRRIARDFGVGVGTVLRLTNEAPATSSSIGLRDPRSRVLG
jgi:DNA invertase Pin-like site-specific DNA recombinase